MKATKGKNMRCSDAAIEFAEGVVYTGAIAQSHSADEGKSFAFEVLSIEAYNAGTEGKHSFSKGERGGRAEISPIRRQAESLPLNSLMAEVAGVIHFTRIPSITGRCKTRMKGNKIAHIDIGGIRHRCGRRINYGAELDELACFGKAQHHTYHTPRTARRLVDDPLSGNGLDGPLRSYSKRPVGHKAIPYCNDCNKEKQE